MKIHSHSMIALELSLSLIVTCLMVLVPHLAEAQTAPANDHFTNRATVTTAATGTNVAATKESGEPNHAGNTGGKSVWWNWTASITGTAYIDIFGSDFAAILAVYQGASVSALTSIASTTDVFVSFPVTAGQTYQIAVDGVSGASGNIQLGTFIVPPPPANDLFAAGLVLPGNTSVISGTTSWASREMNEPFHGGSMSGTSSVWYSWTAPTTGILSLWVTTSDLPQSLGIYEGLVLGGLNTIGGNATGHVETIWVTSGTTYRIAVEATFDTMGAFTLHFGTIIPPPANDDFANRIPITSLPANLNGTTVAATPEVGEPGHTAFFPLNSVWWTWTPSASGQYSLKITPSGFPPAFAVYTGNSLNTLTRTPTGGSSSGWGLEIDVVAGTSYQIAVDTVFSGMNGPFTLTLEGPAPVPPNDSFSTPTVLSGAFAWASGTNRGATKEAGEPDHGGNAGGKSVWYSWTAPASGTFNAYASGKNIGVYTGTAVNALTVAGTPTPGVQPHVFTATSGVTYRIGVDGSQSYYGAANSGVFAVHVSQTPANDLFASAMNLGTSSTGTSSSWVDFSTTSEPGEPDDYGYNPWMPQTRTVWWKWTAPASGFFHFDTLGSDFDTVLEIYTGSGVDSLTRVAVNQDADSLGRSRLSLNAVSGTEYHIRVRPGKADGIGAVSLFYAAISTPVTVADYLRLGRAFLEQQNTGDLANADAQFQAALVMNPTHPEAHFLRALTRLSRLEQGTAFQTALTGLGLSDGDLYLGGHSIPKDMSGQRIVTPGTHTSHGVSYLVNTVLPELIAARGDLDFASSTGFTSVLTDTETTWRMRLIDAGDISMLKATLHMMEATIRLIQTYDAGASMATQIAESNQGTFSLESLVESSANLFEFTGNDQRLALKTSLQNANLNYQSGSTYIRTTRADPLADTHLFYLPANHVDKEEEIRLRAQEIHQSLNGASVVGGKNINLSAALTAGSSLRQQMPGVFGDQAVAGTVPDTTFANVAPGTQHTTIHNNLRRHGLLHDVDTFAGWSQYYLQGQPLASQAAGADPDADTLSNFAEYAFHLDPLRASASSEMAVSSLQTSVADNKTYLHITYRRRTDDPLLHYTVAVSDDLITWDRSHLQVVPVGAAVPNADGITENVTFRVLADTQITQRKFVRVEATVSNQ